MASVIIIGGGPAGVSAGLYTIRANIETTIFTQGGSALVKAEKIENYYGFPNGISGKELYQRGIDSVQNLGAKVIEQEVIGAGYNGKFVVETNTDTYEADALVIANGASRSVPKIKNIKEFEGKGVSYCAVCDAFFYRGKNVAVIGNGDYALHEADVLSKVAENVTILTNGEKAPNYSNCDTRKIVSIEGNDVVEYIVFDDGEKLSVSGVFVAIGVAGGVDLARKLGAIVNGNYIDVNENMNTNVPNLYAVGDCTGGLLQVSKAVCDGAKAGIDIIKNLRDK
ncbi:MAG: FAD-dependent oxidoreductase [Lachnospirales bacterium]